jgi:hypothetical protein
MEAGRGRFRIIQNSLPVVSFVGKSFGFTKSMISLILHIK